MISEAVSMDPHPAKEATSDTVDPVLLRARSGDRVAFEDLLRSHERLVFGTARCLLGAAEDAEDAAQEVFLRLFLNLEHLDPARPLAAWLYRVTVNVCRTFGRRRRARPTVPLADRAEPIHAGADPAAVAEREQEHQMVTQGLETLARKERATVVLHDLEGLSVREVAAALDVSEVTVRTHLCRARQKMRSFRERWHRRTSR